MPPMPTVVGSIPSSAGIRSHLTAEPPCTTTGSGYAKRARVRARACCSSTSRNRNQARRIRHRDAVNSTSAVFDTQTSFSQQPKCQWIDLVLDLEHACGEFFFDLTMAHTDCRLGDDRPRIHLGYDKMDGSSVHLHTRLESPSVCVEPLEGR